MPSFAPICTTLTVSWNFENSSKKAEIDPLDGE